jgi:hypothetical protein
VRQEREQKERALEESEEERKRAQVLFEARELAHQEEQRAAAVFQSGMLLSAV